MNNKHYIIQTSENYTLIKNNGSHLETLNFSNNLIKKLDNLCNDIMIIIKFFCQKKLKLIFIINISIYYYMYY